jgi:hypothetical protein
MPKFFKHKSIVSLELFLQEGIFPIYNFILQHHSGKMVGQVDA